MPRVVRRRRVVRKRRVGRKARVPRMRMKRTYQVPEYASCSVTRTILPVGGGNFLSNQMYSTYGAGGVKLEDYARAVQIAQAYQHYRIKSIKITLKYGFDTFQQANAIPGSGTRPSLYFMIDKSGSIPNNVTLEGLKQMGAKPHTCDNKQFVITFRPAVLTQEYAPLAGDLPSAYKISPWLSTNPSGFGAGVFNPSGVPHNGLYWYIEQLFGGGVQYQAEIEVQFQFKKPLWGNSAGVENAQGFKNAVEDTSSDGIVGGPDSNNLISGVST